MSAPVLARIQRKQDDPAITPAGADHIAVAEQIAGVVAAVETFREDFDDTADELLDGQELVVERLDAVEGAVAHLIEAVGDQPDPKAIVRAVDDPSLDLDKLPLGSGLRGDFTRAEIRRTRESRRATKWIAAATASGPLLAELARNIFGG